MPERSRIERESVRGTDGKLLLREAFRQSMRHQGTHGGGRHKPSPTAIRLLREAVQQAQREHRPLAQVAEEVLGAELAHPVWVAIARERAFVWSTAAVPGVISEAHDADVLAFAKGLVDDFKALADRWEAALTALKLSAEQEFAARHEGKPPTHSELVDFAKEIATAAARDDVRLAQVAPEGLRLALSEQFQAVHGAPPDGDAQSLRLLDRLVGYLEGLPASAAELAPLPPRLQVALLDHAARLDPVDGAARCGGATREARGTHRGGGAAGGAAAAAHRQELKRASRRRCRSRSFRQRWAAVADEFEKAEGRPPETEAEAVAFLKTFLLERRRRRARWRAVRSPRPSRRSRRWHSKRSTRSR